MSLRAIFVFVILGNPPSSVILSNPQGCEGSEILRPLRHSQRPPNDKEIGVIPVPFVIPATAGIQRGKLRRESSLYSWTPVYTGVTKIICCDSFYSFH